MSIKNKSTLSSEKDTYFADNDTEDIQASELRTQQQDLIDSTLNLIEPSTQNVTGPVNFSGIVSQAGDFFIQTTNITMVDADKFKVGETSAAGKVKDLTGTALKAYLKTYFDTIYTGGNFGSNFTKASSAGTSSTSSATETTKVTATITAGMPTGDYFVSVNFFYWTDSANKIFASTFKVDGVTQDIEFNDTSKQTSDRHNFERSYIVSHTAGVAQTLTLNFRALSASTVNMSNANITFWRAS